ncbi:hypothetical protein BC835DRAFT_1414648 [Cytidiella melzeri]|nr:hypothetical protein BC835DRAFT_1414648 [Cytidiella melzeri]
MPAASNNDNPPRACCCCPTVPHSPTGRCPFSPRPREIQRRYPTVPAPTPPPEPSAAPTVSPERPTPKSPSPASSVASVADSLDNCSYCDTQSDHPIPLRTGPFIPLDCNRPRAPHPDCWLSPDFEGEGHECELVQFNLTSSTNVVVGHAFACAHSSTDTNSPNYGWPVAAHYVAPPPSLPVSLKVQPSLLQQIIRTAIRSATGDYLFKTAYPSDKNHWKGLRTILRRCATRLELNEYAEHFEKDVAFGEDIAQILVARFANRRGDVKSNASTCAAGYYSLLPGEECKDRVKDLTESYTYIFPEEAGVMKQNKPFKHPCIIKVITKSFFESGRGGRSSLADKHSKLFSSSCEEGPKRDELELPIPIVALAATAVHCALLEWKTGEHSKLSFHGDTYQPVYERHVKVLEDIRNDHAKYHRMMADLYKTVSRGKNTAGEVNTVALVDLAAMEE